MSGCEPFRERLQEALDERLDPAQRPALEEHLRGCAACAREAAGLRRLRTALRALPRPSAPPGFREGVERRIATPGRLFRLPQWLAAAAAAAVVVAAVSLSVRREAERDVAVRMPLREASEAAPPRNGISLDDVSDAIAEDEKPGTPDAAAFESKARDEGDVGLRDGAARPEGPAGEIAAESRRPADPGPPKAPGTVPSPEPAQPPAEPPSAAAASAAPSADPVPPPRVRLVVFRDRAAADRFVAAMATSNAPESGAPRGQAEPGADAGRRAPGAPAGRAPKGGRPRDRASDDRTKDAPGDVPGAKEKGDASPATIPEVARLGLATAERLAAARAAATAEGGGVSEPIAFTTAHDATVPADLARAVAAELRRATPSAPVTGPQAAGAAPGRERDVAGGGAVGGGTPRGAPATGGGGGADDPAMKRARRSEDSGEAPPAARGAWEAADAASAATEILIVVVVPDTAPSAPPR